LPTPWENTIAAQIHRLRKVLEGAGGDVWLETVHGFGYRVNIPAHRDSLSYNYHKNIT